LEGGTREVSSGRGLYHGEPALHHHAGRAAIYRAPPLLPSLARCIEGLLSYTTERESLLSYTIERERAFSLARYIESLLSYTIYRESAFSLKRYIE
jgi:hypothetical protein